MQAVQVLKLTRNKNPIQKKVLRAAGDIRAPLPQAKWEEISVQNIISLGFLQVKFVWESSPLPMAGSETE